MNEDKRLRVLVWSDSPAATTGFATVTRNILKVLDSTGLFDFTVVGINQTDWYDRNKYPYEIHEAMPALLDPKDSKHIDLQGRARVLEFLERGDFDIFFCQNDTFNIASIAAQIIDLKKTKKFQWIAYVPVDSKVDTDWVGWMPHCDFPVVYTHYGKNEIEKALNMREFSKLRVIHLGVDTDIFKPLDDKKEIAKWKQDLFGEKANGKFMLVNVNRNQYRKAIPHTFAMFSELLKMQPESFLYVHAKNEDSGVASLDDIASSFPNLKAGENWSRPTSRLLLSINPIGMNKIYNMADAVISTTTGEGFGLSFVEAMAAGKPVIAPWNTSIEEIIGKTGQRGFLCPCGHDWSMYPHDHARLRPLPDIEFMKGLILGLSDPNDMVAARFNPEESLKFAREHDWRVIGKKWFDIFIEAAKNLTD